MSNAKETRSTITLATLLLLLVAFLVLDVAAIPFLEKKGLLELAAILEALELPMLLGGSMFIVAYASGYLRENLKKVSINVAIFTLLFLLGKILVSCLSVFLSLVVFKADIQEIFSVFAEVLLWLLLFIAMTKRVDRSIKKDVPYRIFTPRLILVVISCLFVVSLVIVEYVVIYPALVASIDFDSMSHMELIDYMTAGDNIYFTFFHSIELLSWWVLAAACIWWRLPKEFSD